jgi:hypothetical protein
MVIKNVKELLYSRHLVVNIIQRNSCTENGSREDFVSVYHALF